MFDTKKIKEMRDFYHNHLFENIIPFWINKAVDWQNGGYFTCFDNTGETLISKDKYTWSQGRLVWNFAKISIMDDNEITVNERKKFLELAEIGANFLMKNCLLENGNCTFLMDKKGNPKPTGCGMSLDSSIYADCFVVLGLSLYSYAAHDERALNFAKRLYVSIINRIDNDNYKTEPYPIPKGFKTHGIPMILLNVSQELWPVLIKFEDRMSSEVRKKAVFYMNEIVNNFIRKQNIVLEMLTKNNEEVDNLLGRYINPGHSIEDMWFIMKTAQDEDKKEIIKKAVEVIKKTFLIGWDKEYGGLLLFADKNGGKPKGNVLGFENDPMVNKVLNDWDTKLWWPHVETLYSTLRGYELTGDESLLEIYNKVYDYTFNVFPNKNKKVGEWIQIRDRYGEPIKKVVALPVKDPFHIMRSLTLIIELLNRLKAKSL